MTRSRGDKIECLRIGVGHERSVRREMLHMCGVF
jgi:hypothetical protein